MHQSIPFTTDVKHAIKQFNRTKDIVIACRNVSKHFHYTVSERLCIAALRHKITRQMFVIDWSSETDQAHITCMSLPTTVYYSDDPIPIESESAVLVAPMHDATQLYVFWSPKLGNWIVVSGHVISPDAFDSCTYSAFTTVDDKMYNTRVALIKRIGEQLCGLDKKHAHVYALCDTEGYQVFAPRSYAAKTAEITITSDGYNVEYTEKHQIMSGHKCVATIAKNVGYGLVVRNDTSTYVVKHPRFRILEHFYNSAKDHEYKLKPALKAFKEVFFANSALFDADTASRIKSLWPIVLTPEQEEIGEKIYELAETVFADKAAKITGMILELPIAQLRDIVADTKKTLAWIADANRTLCE